MQNWIRSAATGMFLERPGKKLSLQEHAATLAANGDGIRQRLATLEDTDANRQHLRHIIGIERWSQRRLRVFLGDTDPGDDSDDYRPAADLSWKDLLDAFRQTRLETVNLTSELAQSDVDDSQTVTHDQYGKISVYGWLRFLDVHANMESKHIQ